MNAGQLFRFKAIVPGLTIQQVMQPSRRFTKRASQWKTNVVCHNLCRVEEMQLAACSLQLAAPTATATAKEIQRSMRLAHA
jgi:hypothetical protein